MAECLINMSGGSIDIDGLTASAKDVVSPKKFYGSGNEEIQQGSIPDKGALSHYMAINETYRIPAGFYTGGSVKQSITVLGEQRVTPTSKTITLQTKDKYMGGNIIVSSIANLRPENIKKGEYVGGVGPGTWEGYVVTDPKIFYQYGSFAPGQSLKGIKYDEKAGIFQPSFRKKDILFMRNSYEDEKRIAAVFTKPIDISGINKLKIEFEAYRSGSIGITLAAYGYRNISDVFYKTIDGSYNRDHLGEQIFYITKDFPKGVSNDFFDIDLGSFSRNIYVYLILGITDTDDYITIKLVQFT